MANEFERVLFRDTELELKEQLEMIKRLSEQFNLFVEGEDANEIDLEELRTNLRPASDRKISSWVKLARLRVLSTFGKEGEMNAAVRQFYGSSESESAKGNVVS